MPTLWGSPTPWFWTGAARDGFSPGGPAPQSFWLPPCLLCRPGSHQLFSSLTPQPRPGPALWCLCPGLTADITPPRTGHGSWAWARRLETRVAFTHTPSQPMKDVTELTRVWLEPRTSTIKGPVSSGLCLTSRARLCSRDSARPPGWGDACPAPQQGLCCSAWKAPCSLLPPNPHRGLGCPNSAPRGYLVSVSRPARPPSVLCGPGAPQRTPQQEGPGQTEASLHPAQVRRDNG